MSREARSDERPRYAAVAVPLPLPTALTYEVPPAFAPLARPGARARVRVGSRRLVGVIVDLPEEPPEDVTLRPLEEVVDLEPALPPDLLELAAFTADYYLAPLGEVLRTMLPSGLAPRGDRRATLTDAGAIARPRDPVEAEIVELLRDRGRMGVADLQRHVGGDGLAAALERLSEAGRIALGERRTGGARYVNAVELPPGDLEAQLEACGRSRPGREVVEYLAAAGRPATSREVEEAVGCGRGVVRRLVKLGVLRQFTQVERHRLERHLLEGGEDAAIRLRPDQRSAAEAIRGAVEAGRYQGFLLSGITGSGKTEVYLRGIEAALAAGRSAILLVPEIALVPALARTVRQRFGGRSALLHSALSGGERQQEWERVRRGEAQVVVGPRSAVFAPVVDLGFLVVDEEQDSSYKQEVAPRYSGRDLALVRGSAAGAPVVLASATPSLESRFNVGVGKLTEVRLTERVGSAGLPEGTVVDLRDEEVPRRPGEVGFSRHLLAEIERTLAAGDQIILLRNRRGYSPMMLCRACGDDLRCDACGLPRTYHRRAGALQCHYCGSTLAVPESCPECGEAALEAIGAGTERVEERLREMFPEIAVDVLDRDASSRPGGAAAVLERFASGATRILVGTQMVSKGHHFPRVALTAVLLADTYLGFPDFRAVERTYTLLTQLAGRAGRGDRPGRVVIQSYHPDHYAIRAALDNDDAGFAAEEMRFRRVFRYPPYTRMVQLLVRDEDRDRAQRQLHDLARRLLAHHLSEGVRISGPAPAPLERLRDRWRFQLLLRAESGKRLRRLLAEVLPSPTPSELVIDVDPQQLL